MTEFKKYRNKETGDMVEAKYLNYIKNFFIPNPAKECKDIGKWGCQNASSMVECPKLCESYLDKSTFNSKYQPIENENDK